MAVMRAWLPFAVLCLTSNAEFQNLFEACMDTSSVNIDAPKVMTHRWNHIDDVRPCLDSRKMSLHEMDTTLKSLLFGESTIYSFTDIVRNSTDSVQQTTCGLDVHEISVNLRSQLEDLYDRLVLPEMLAQGMKDASSPEELAAMVTAPTNVSAMDFHGKLADLFAALKDAHTVYRHISFAFLVLNVDFSFLPDADGRPTVFTKTQRGQKEVKSINGGRPLDFLQGLADKMGTDLDSGARLNRLVMGSSITELVLEMVGGNPFKNALVLGLGFDMSSLPAGGETEVELVFDDFREVHQWAVHLNPNVVSVTLQKFNEQYLTVQHAKSVRAEMNRRQMDECKTIPDCAANLKQNSDVSLAALPFRGFADHFSDEFLGATAMLVASKEQSNQPGLEIELEHETLLEMLRSVLPEHQAAMADASSSDSFVEQLRQRRPTNLWSIPSIKPAAHAMLEMVKVVSEKAMKMPFRLFATESHSDPKEMSCNSNIREAGGKVVLDEAGIDIVAVDDMLVLKIEDFMHPDIGRAWVTLVEYAEDNGIKRLLVDIISNKGGIVVLSDMLKAVIQKSSDPDLVCSLYNKRMDKYWSYWISSYGNGTETLLAARKALLEKHALNSSLEDVRWYGKWQLTHLLGLSDLSRTLTGKPGTSASEKIRHYLSEVLSATDMITLVHIMKTVLSDMSLFPRFQYPGMQSTGGYFPMVDGELYNPDTKKPYTAAEGFTGVDEFWGGTSSTYSQKGIFAPCLMGMKTLDNRKRGGMLEHPFEEIALVSDGLAGSAGSNFPSELIASRRAVMFTFGGNGGPLDSSSFAGGNVLQYRSWWPMVAASAEYGMWLLPGSPWEKESRRLQSNLTRGADNSPVYPMPLPGSSTMVSFNYNMMYVGRDKTELPRQFYRQPGHKHYSRWPKRVNKLCGNPTELISLYKQIQSEDWGDLMRHPACQGKGWSGSCVGQPRPWPKSSWSPWQLSAQQPALFVFLVAAVAAMAFALFTVVRKRASTASTLQEPLMAA